MIILINKMRTLSILLAVGLFFLSCSRTKTEDMASHASTAKLAIYVRKDGTILINSKVKTLQELDTALKKQKTKGGIVFYSRADLQHDPPETALLVMDMIAKEELPIQFYTDSTFTQIYEFK